MQKGWFTRSDNNPNLYDGQENFEISEVYWKCGVKTQSPQDCRSGLGSYSTVRHRVVQGSFALTFCLGNHELHILRCSRLWKTKTHLGKNPFGLRYSAKSKLQPLFLRKEVVKQKHTLIEHTIDQLWLWEHVGCEHGQRWVRKYRWIWCQIIGLTVQYWWKSKSNIPKCKCSKWTGLNFDAKGFPKTSYQSSIIK